METRSHRDVLGSKSVGEHIMKPKTDDRGSSWKKIRSWETRHAGYKKMFREIQFVPNEIAWSPDGSHLISVADFRSHREVHFMGGNSSVNFWDIGGQLVAESRYSGYPRMGEVYWNDLSTHLLNRVPASPTRPAFWMLLGSGLKQIFTDISGASFGLNEEAWSGNKSTAFSPFRPGSSEVLYATQSTGRPCEFWVFEYGKQSESVSSLEFLSKKKLFDLQFLGAPHGLLLRFSWDPSGSYVAITTSHMISDDSSNYGVAAKYSTYIVHADSGELVSAISNKSLEHFGWSPRGRLLYCIDHEAATRDEMKTFVWDAVSDEVREPSESEVTSRWLQRFEFGSRTTHSGIVPQSFFKVESKHSADFSQTIKRNNNSVEITSLEDPQTCTSLELGGSVIAAMWSPSDPNEFAAIVGIESEGYIQIWRKE